MKKSVLCFVGLIFVTSATASSDLLPLKSSLVLQYQCNPHGIYSFFNPRVRPLPVPAELEGRLVCHDVTQYGPRDDFSYPRLNEKSSSFKLWSRTNPMFFDNNGDGNMDISNYISDQARTDYNVHIPPYTQWFYDLELPFSQRHTNGHLPTLGYFMSAFIDQVTFKSYCLKSWHYQSSIPLFRILGKVLKKDTEGLYIGERTHGSGFKSYIYVGETELKKTWFYLKNGVRTTPTDDVVSSVEVFFVYEGIEFKLRGRNELNLPAMGMNLGGLSTNYPTHDRKIGCVPKE